MAAEPFPTKSFQSWLICWLLGGVCTVGLMSMAPSRHGQIKIPTLTANGFGTMNIRRRRYIYALASSLPPNPPLLLLGVFHFFCSTNHHHHNHESRKYPPPLYFCPTYYYSRRGYVVGGGEERKGLGCEHVCGYVLHLSCIIFDADNIASVASSLSNLWSGDFIKARGAPANTSESFAPDSMYTSSLIILPLLPGDHGGRAFKNYTNLLSRISCGGGRVCVPQMDYS